MGEMEEMEGVVDLRDLRLNWEVRASGKKGPARCALHVAYGQLGVSRLYVEDLTREQAQKEAERLAPEVLAVGA
jgi:hypothetical protein